MSSALQYHFEHYIRDVRKRKESTANHYVDALNNISKRLKEMGLVEDDIYEVRDITELQRMKEVLLQDEDFVRLNSQGHSMYSAGLNNYIKFAAGVDFQKAISDVRVMDIPVPAPQQTIVYTRKWSRQDIIRVQSIELAQYKCEIDAKHETFLVKANHKPYMEGHHAIPMHYQQQFSNSLDVYANVICLCPICHRKMHYGLDSERKVLLDRLYGERSDRLGNCGIDLSRKDFVSLGMS